MNKIYYVQENKEIDAISSKTILEVSLEAGIPLVHICGGNARCSTCRVAILEGLDSLHPRNDKEQALARQLGLEPNIRLACQTRVYGNLKLRRLVVDDEDCEDANQLGENITVNSAGEEKKIAILFSDIRGFTPFTEDLLPYDVIHILNRYFRQIGKAITQNGGCINNYMGDGILALFGLDDSSQAVFQAVKTGLEMLKAMEKFKPYLQNTYGKSFDIGIGVHWGEVVVGSLGAIDHQKVTVIGDAVNLASRIESANKESGTKFLVSEDTWHQISDQVIGSPALTTSLKGKTGTHTLYEITELIEMNPEVRLPD